MANTSSRSTTRSAPRRSAGMTSATTTSRRSCRPTTAAWSCSTTESSCSPIRRTRPSTLASTLKHSAREGERYVREERREVLHRRRPHPFLGRKPRQLGQGPGGVRQGLDRVLPRLHGAGSAGDALADREVHEVL